MKTPTVVEEDDTALTSESQLDVVVDQNASGAFAIAGLASAIVIGLYLAFYFFVYLPRGVVQ